jgi:hypothetical protein
MMYPLFVGLWPLAAGHWLLARSKGHARKIKQGNINKLNPYFINCL